MLAVTLAVRAEGDQLVLAVSDSGIGHCIDARTGTIADPTVETMGAQSENYGPLKALCEQAAEAAMPGSVDGM